MVNRLLACLILYSLWKIYSLGPASVGLESFVKVTDFCQEINQGECYPRIFPVVIHGKYTISFTDNPFTWGSTHLNIRHDILSGLLPPNLFYCGSTRLSIKSANRKLRRCGIAALLLLLAGIESNPGPRYNILLTGIAMHIGIRLNNIQIMRFFAMSPEISDQHSHKK